MTVLLLLLLLPSSSIAWIIPLTNINIMMQNSIRIKTSGRQPIQKQLKWPRCLLPTSFSTCLHASPKAGTFFNPIPDDDETRKNNDNVEDDDNSSKYDNSDPRRRGISGLGFGKQTDLFNSNNNNDATNLFQSQLHTPRNQKPFLGIGPPMNDVTKPEYDENGYTLYADERTGIKSRVFEALVDYPCMFTLKIVGQNHDSFVSEILLMIAQSCCVYDQYVNQPTETIPHTTRINGKWISITVQAPVQSAEMLYQLYENVDQHPLVKFKF